MKKDNIYIFNCNWERINYGAVLTAYALQQVLFKITNKSNFLVDNPSFVFLECYDKYNSFERFKQRYMKFSERIVSYKTLLALNKKSNIFITGSDQVFRFPLINKIKYGFEQYLLTFTDPDAKRIAFSASFGVDKEQFIKENSAERIEKYKLALQSFDAVSVREKSGVEICKDLFDVKATWLIDPVFLLGKLHYESLANKNAELYSDKIVSYIFDKNKKREKAILTQLSHKYNTDIIELYKTNIDIEEWLTAIKNCKFLITNSFHGVCFAIIFNKPFMCYVNASSGMTRYESLFQMLGMSNKCAIDMEEILTKECLFDMDYKVVNKNIDKQVEKAISFYKKAIEGPSVKSEERLHKQISLLQNQICQMEDNLTLKQIIINYFWDKWLVTYYKFPEFIKNIIRKLRDKNV